MAWLLPVLAGLFEAGGPRGPERSPQPVFEVRGMVGAAVAIGASGGLLRPAQRAIPLGTAGAVWAGIGRAGTFIIGVICFGDVPSLARRAGVAVLVGGVVMLKLAR